MRRILFVSAMLGLALPALAEVTADTVNPFDGKADAAAAGQALFGKMNCAGCHAYDLTGGMGPDLTDSSWLYGGRPGEIYHTIAEGTPRGMPSWKDKLSSDEIWQIVTYIQSKHGN